MYRSLRLFVALAAALLPASVLGQTASVDAPLARLIGARATAAPGTGGNTPGAARTGQEETLGLIVYTRDVAALRATGLPVEAAFDGFAVVRASLDQVEVLRRTRGVTQVALGLDEELHNDVAASMVGARALHEGLLGDQPYTGAGAIVCVLDTGIDWKHLDFRSLSDPSKSRILRLYDMSLTAQGGETTPQGLPTSYSTGVEYTQAQLNDELDGTPAGFVRSQDTHGHGTHVAGTAAGNGGSMTPRQHVGMAPDADIVFVKGTNANNVFPSANILNAIKYCGEVATVENKPMVMNMSLGSAAGPHDGTDAKSAAITQLVATPGRVVVQSAGNEGGTNFHHVQVINASASQSFTFNVPVYTPTAGSNNFAADLWASQDYPVSVTLTAPDGVTSLTVSDGFNSLNSAQGYMEISNTIASNGDRNIVFYVGDYLYLDGNNQVQVGGTAPAQGAWTLRLDNGPDGQNVVHAWAYDRTVGSGAVTLTGADATYTVSNAAADAIAVGAYTHRWLWRSSNGSSYVAASGAYQQDLRAPFSSQGPSRDGRVMPHISAPGQMIISSRSANTSPAASALVAGNLHLVNQGTSMSSPVVAGSVALLLGASPNLTAAQVKTLLSDNAVVDTPVSNAGAVPNNQFGAGKLNVYQAMARLVNPASTSTLTNVQYDAPGTNTSGVTLNQGNNLVIRFQMPMNGRLRGLNFHTSAAVPSGGFDVRLWQNNAGVPGAQIGSTVNAPGASLQLSGWNYFSLSSLTDALVAGDEYFLSVTPVGSNGSYRHDGTNNAGRSYSAPEARAIKGADAPGAFGGQGISAIGALTATTGDVLMRPVVSSDAAAILPVELVAFEGVQSGRTAALTWITASETNNAGWTIQQMGSGPDDWRDLGFVQGAGTTTEVQRYAFATETLLPGTYSFRLRQTDTDGSVHYSGLVMIEIGVDRALALLPAGPNPFAGRTTLLLTVPQDGPAKAALFDVLGRRVQSLFDGAAVAGEAHALVVDGAALAPGTYFVRAESGGRVVQRTLVVAR